MSLVLQTALAWHNAGVSTVPIVTGGTKRPAVKWAAYQAKAPELGEVDAWWRNGSEYGLALICGAVSGNLEMVELEGRVTDSASLERLEAVLDAQGVREVWDTLAGPYGYAEWSPSGGMHLLYRISDYPVPGNSKIATNADSTLVYAETRGEGGYVIVAPTSGLCHKSGEPWLKTRGRYGVLPTITWSQRCALHEAIKLALDERPQVPAPLSSTVPPIRRSSGAGLSPGDDFEESTDWAEILEPHGWRLESRRGRERFWTRPDKDRKDGASATTGNSADRDRLYVFSTSTIFDSEVPYTKFGAYALLNHGGNFSEAASALVRLGFGERLEEGLPYLSDQPQPGHQVDARTLRTDDRVPVRNTFFHDEAGNSERLWDRTKGRFHYVAETKDWITWTGKVWQHDFDGSLTREVKAMTLDMVAEADAFEDEKLGKWARASRSQARITATMGLMKSEEGCTRRAADLDKDRHLVNVDNGILDLRTRSLGAHDPGRLITRMFGTRYDPDAKCPQFEQFMADVLPNQDIRDYVQRCLGYTLQGDADQRALFLVHGPSGTGKSQFIETMRYLFGDYGVTAPAGTFRTHRDHSGPNNDLHMLRGRRFVATSETADNAAFDEDLIKRITGRDMMASRGLYEQFQEWTPECSIWIATNYPPRFNSDDDAIWRRAKLVPFLTQFTSDGEHKEIPDIARNVLAHELPGILNWLLDGLAAYQEVGLAEPECIAATAAEHRSQSDSVVRFLEDAVADGKLALGEDATISTMVLSSIYESWCRTSGDRKLSAHRFNNRLLSSGHGLSLSARVWRGVGRAPGASVLGTFILDR